MVRRVRPPLYYAWESLASRGSTAAGHERLMIAVRNEHIGHVSHLLGPLR